MFILIQFIFFLVFYIHKLYYLIVNEVMLSATGGKLDRYTNNLKNITCSLKKTQNLTHLILLFFNISPLIYKKIILSFFVSIVILILNISLSYKFLVSNVLFIKVFNKSIDISLILSENYIIFKLFYYILFFIFVFNIVYKIYSRFLNYKNSPQNIDINNTKEMYDVEIKTTNIEKLIFKEKGLYQNILITGSIGSGKTSSAISNILSQFIKNRLGGLVIDIKGNYINQIKKMANIYGRREDIIEISLDNKYIYNPLDNKSLSSAEMANIMIKVLTLISKNNNNSEPFWLDKAEEYIRDFITLIRAYNNGCVNFKEIHNLVINKEYLNKKINILKELILSNKFSEEQLFDINNAIINIKNDFLSLDTRTFGIIRAEITRMTSVFLSNIKIYNKFCGKGGGIDFNSNKIYVLSLDISNNDKLSKIIGTYVKLQFQREILSNNSRDSPVFFVCDEYQEICNCQDANFFSLSREYKCINTISMQSYSSLVNALGNEHVSNVILQNFVNKIWFRNDDDYTVKKVISQLGKEKIVNISKSYNEQGRNSRYNSFINKFVSFKTDFSKSYTENENIQNKYNEEFFTQQLKTFEAMCLISDGNKMNLYERIKIKRWEEDI